MRWWTYERWCKETGRPCLVIPQGINGIDDRVYADDGFLYVKGKKVDKYMRVQRYSGLDLLVRVDEIQNIARFEAARWTMLRHIKDLLAKKADLETRLYNHIQGVYGPDGDKARGMHNGVLCEVDFFHDKYTGRRVDGGPRKGWHKLDPLEQMALIPKDDRESRLVVAWFTFREKIEKYWVKASNFSSALGWLLHEEHPDVKVRRARPWKRTVTFKINGRFYPVTVGAGLAKDIDYWPSPMDHPIIEI